MIYYKKNPVPYNHNRYNPSFEYMFVLSKNKINVFNGIRTKRITEYKDNNAKRFRYTDGTLKKGNSQKNTTDKLKNNVWEISCSVDSTGHPAPFPEKLAEDHIISWSNKNDVVLDIFMGSGTTAKMALVNDRQFIGFEISKEYCDIANKRIDYYKRQGKLDL